MKDNIIIAALGILVVIGLMATTGSDGNPLGGISDAACTTSSVAAITVGNQESSTVVSAASNRAIVLIQQPANATNTVSLSVDEGAAANVGDGLELTAATTTSPVTHMTFGRHNNADIPYTGAITGITDSGSTTVLVTQCNY